MDYEGLNGDYKEMVLEHWPEEKSLGIRKVIHLSQGKLPLLVEVLEGLKLEMEELE